jgi:hypothetical protein
MNIRKIIERRIRHSGGGVDVVGDVNAVIAANVNEPGTTSTRVSSRQTVVHHGGRSEVVNEKEEGVIDDAPREG